MHRKVFCQHPASCRQIAPHPTQCSTLNFSNLCQFFPKRLANGRVYHRVASPAVYLRERSRTHSARTQFPDVLPLAVTTLVVTNPTVPLNAPSNLDDKQKISLPFLFNRTAQARIECGQIRRYRGMCVEMPTGQPPTVYCGLLGDWKTAVSLRG